LNLLVVLAFLPNDMHHLSPKPTKSLAKATLTRHSQKQEYGSALGVSVNALVILIKNETEACIP
jgi:hypothetical protein